MSGSNEIIFDKARFENKDKMGRDLIFMIREGLSSNHAEAILPHRPNLLAVDPATGFTAFHAAAAVGRQDLFDLFASAVTPPYSQRDNLGRSPSDLAAIVARDFELCEHICEMEAVSLGL